MINSKDLLLNLMYTQCSNMIYNLNKIKQTIEIIQNKEGFNNKINEVINKLDEIFLDSEIELNIKYDYIGISCLPKGYEQ